MTRHSQAQGAGGSAQIPLVFAHRQALGREDFVVTGSNAPAVALVDRWPDWPGPAAAVWGPAGCGKSHLVAVFRDRADARVLTAEALDLESLPDRLGKARAWVLDDAEDVLQASGSRPDRQRVLLHLLNLAGERRGHLLLASCIAPARWQVTLPDLSSRLAAITAVPIAQPDDELLAYLFVKLFADRQLVVPERVVSYLIHRVERSFEAVRSTVDRLDRLSLTRKKPVSLRMVREVLEDDAE